MDEQKLQTAVVQAGGMTCGHCVATVEAALQALDGVEDAVADLDSQSARVGFDPARVSLADLEQSVADAGYAPQPAAPLITLSPASPQVLSDDASEASAERYRLAIEGMTCASCVRSIEQAALQVPGVQSCDVSLAESTAHVVLDPSRSGPEDVMRSIRDIGYGADLAAEAGDPLGTAEVSRSLARRLKVSVALTVPLLVLAMSGDMLSFPGSVWVQLALVLPVVVYGGAPFYSAAWKAALHFRSDMNTLVAVGTGTAFAYSAAATLAPVWVSGSDSAPVYFETAAAILTLVLVGRVMETRARHRTSASIRKLLELQAGSVRLRRDGAEVSVSPEEVVVGDEVVLRPGERVPVDGMVIEGSGAVDEAPITGESLLADKSPGSKIVSGSLNKDGFLVVRAASVGRDTVLSRIIEFVRIAQASKAPAARLADRIAAVFVPVILVVAVLTFAAWLVLGPAEDALSMAVNCAVSVLIIACPCALGLATPAALAVGIGRAAERGILVRDGAAFEAARSVDTVVFDKTGTLTKGEFEVTDCKPFGGMEPDEFLGIAGAIESRSEHPIAKAVAAAVPETGVDVDEYRTLPGAGASGRVAGQEWLLGKPDLLSERGVDLSEARPAVASFEREGKAVVLAARAGVLAGVIALRDSLRPEAPVAVEALRERGIRSVMISGDHEEAARAVASEAGVTEVLAPVLPVGKADAIRGLQEQGRVVAMVGDGINDAPALTQADLGIAIGAGTDIAIESAGIVLVRDDPSDASGAIELAKRMQRTIRQNYVWAFGYNVLGIPVAAGLLYPWVGLLLSPMIASAAMALSSVSVLWNSLRLRKA